MEKMAPCTFSQRQGYITITREDGDTWIVILDNGEV